MTGAAPAARLVAVTLDEGSIGRSSPEREEERRVAMRDLVESNRFGLPGREGGPYRLALARRDGKLILAVSNEAGDAIVSHGLSLQPFRSLIRDYLLLCEHHDAAIRAGGPGRIEAVDMGRRGLHNEGAERLGERLRGKIEADFDTLRRLFTLLAALHG